MAGLAINDPVFLWAALQSGNIKPGDTLWLRGGRYTNPFPEKNSIYSIGFPSGTAENPITIRAYPGERAIIDGVINASTNYLILRDLEFDYSGWPSTRHTDETGSDPALFEPERNLQLTGEGTKIINCVLHNCYNGLLNSNGNYEANGCVVYYGGWSAPDRGHGHGTYFQHANLDTTCTIKDCILFWGFELGIKIYRESGSLNNISMIGNTLFCNNELYHLPGTQNMRRNILAGGYVEFVNPVIQNNMTYHRNNAEHNFQANDLGWVGGASNVIFTDNYMPDGWASAYCTPSYTTNTGNYTDAALGNQVFIRPNDYQSDRANVTIYNQAEADTVTVDLTTVTGLAVGDSVRVLNVQDYFEDIQTLTLDGDKKITVNMQAANRTVETPRYWDAPVTTFPVFGCFVVTKI